MRLTGKAVNPEARHIRTPVEAWRLSFYTHGEDCLSTKFTDLTQHGLDLFGGIVDAGCQPRIADGVGSRRCDDISPGKVIYDSPGRMPVHLETDDPGR